MRNQVLQGMEYVRKESRYHDGQTVTVFVKSVADGMVLYHIRGSGRYIPTHMFLKFYQLPDHDHLPEDLFEL